MSSIQPTTPSATSVAPTVQLHQDNVNEQDVSPWVSINIPEIQPAAIQAGGIPRPPNPLKSTSSPPIIYVIRHGEKIVLPKHSKDKEPDGLEYEGFVRANTLPLVFNDQSRSNPYDIRLIIAMQPQPMGDQERPFQTIWPLFLSLSQDNNYCLLDNSVHEESVKLAARRIKEFIASGSSGNILLCWEHHRLTDILTNFGFKVAPDYPPNFDIVWVLNPKPKPDPSGTLLESLGYSQQPSAPSKNSYSDLNPDDQSTPPPELSLWTWDTIEWYAEGISAVSNESSVIQSFIDDENKAKGHALTTVNPKVPNGFITQLAKGESGPTFAWAPYVHGDDGDD